jgi:serine phosphatase RsbU (regulator of sigma subunit)
VVGYQVAGACVPAAEVGGDFFDWYVVDGQLHLTIADVMGKGIGSAILAATVRAVMRSSARTSNLAEAIAAAAHGLAGDLDETAAFVTMFTARLDPERGVLTYVDAGHALTLVVGADGNARRLPTDDLPIGIGAGDSWTEHQVTLAPGETLISVSDGMLDFFVDVTEIFDAARTVVQATDTADEIVGEIVMFAKARRPADDVTAVVVRRER